MCHSYVSWSNLSIWLSWNCSYNLISFPWERWTSIGIRRKAGWKLTPTPRRARTELTVLQIRAWALHSVPTAAFAKSRFAKCSLLGTLWRLRAKILVGWWWSWVGTPWSACFGNGIIGWECHWDCALWQPVIRFSHHPLHIKVFTMWKHHSILEYFLHNIEVAC